MPKSFISNPNIKIAALLDSLLIAVGRFHCHNILIMNNMQLSNSVKSDEKSRKISPTREKSNPSVGTLVSSVRGRVRESAADVQS
jgi:hypothetical protein